MASSMIAGRRALRFFAAHQAVFPRLPLRRGGRANDVALPVTNGRDGHRDVDPCAVLAQALHVLPLHVFAEP